jgi:hypothetical protein
MSDLNCVNCGSSNLKFLRDNHFIISQSRYKELTILKQQKQKQLKQNNYKKPLDKFSMNVSQNFNPNIKYNIKNIFFNPILFLFSLFGFGFFLSIYLSVVLDIKIILLFGFVFALSILYILFVLILLIFKFKQIDKNSQRYKKEIKTINEEIQMWLNLYYCYDCNQVMDLETQLYDRPKNIHKLVNQLWHHRFSKKLI